MRRLSAALLFAFVLAGPLRAEDAPPEDPARLSDVTIVGSSAAARDIGGSAHFIGPDELETFEYGDIHRVLRQVPGVYLQDEEGYGLRPNIGIRGSGMDRSSRIALLEDGVLIAPAPYAAPAAYYFPTTRRMYAAEVLKGPSSVPIGPRTIGGALNLVSTPIPTGWGLYGDYFRGPDASSDAHFWGGGSTDHFGFLLETVQQATDGFKTVDANNYNTKTGYEIEDYLLRGRVNTDPEGRWYQGLEVKLGNVTQDSDASYLGLTEADFAADPFRRYTASQRDHLDSEHLQRQLSWFLEPSHLPWKLRVTAYNNDFERAWYKLQSVGGTGLGDLLENPESFSEQMSWVRGADSPDDALVIRNNSRRYDSEGIQGRGEWPLAAGPADVLLKGGFRFHEDEEDRFQNDDAYRMAAGDLVLTSAGAPGSQDNRVGSAEVESWFVTADVDLGAWRVSPGLRYESIDLTRTDYSREDPDRSDGPTQVLGHGVSELISGLSATWAASERVKLIGGIHEGFNPPAPGSNAGPETSTNWELGARYQGARLRAEAIAFFTDYDNLVGTVTESTGGGGEIGDQFEAGAAHVQGLELLASMDLAQWRGWTVPASLTWTWTQEAEFDNSFASDFDPWGDVVAGDEMPYVPEHLGQIALGLENGRFGLHLNLNYQDETRTRAGSGAIPASESTDSAFVVDLAADWALTQRLGLVARIQNLLDEEYVASRSPAGVRPGIDRWALFGLRATF